MTSTDQPLLLRDDVDGITTLTLNRPKQFNPLSSEMIATLSDTLHEIGRDESVRVVIIAGSGKAFSAGHDLREMRSTDDSAFIVDLFNRCADMMLTITHIPQPVIARVNGIATAAGCQLVANCDLAIASDTARFAVSGINLGLACSSPIVPLSRNILRKRAMEMLLTGDFIDAETATEYGLINRAVPADELESATLTLAEKIRAKPAVSIGIGKQSFYRQLPLDLSEAYALGADRMACNMDTDEAREGFDAFLEKRKPSWAV
ncbi:MAG: enoyl-CoA hydratase [Gammaproteobacteria bacterium]